MALLVTGAVRRTHGVFDRFVAEDLYYLLLNPFYFYFILEFLAAN